MPNTSGVNTHVSLDDLTEHLAAAARLADDTAARLGDDTAARLADETAERFAEPGIDRRDSGGAPA
jgi:hypothetical protein